MTEPVFPDFPPTVPNAIRASAERWGDKVFLVTPDERMSFAELDRRSRALAARLVEAGAVKGTRIGVLFPNEPAWLVSWAAAARIGAITVPVSTFYKVFELGRFLRHADVQILLLTPKFLNNDYVERLESVAPELTEQDASRPLMVPTLPQLRHVMFWRPSPRPWAMGNLGDGLDGPVDAPLGAVVDAMEADVFPGDPMMLMYTSGSTADPKGVLHSHGGMVRHAYNLAAMATFDDTEVMWSPMPFFWVGGFHTVMFRTLVSGGTLVTQGSVDPPVALKMLEREKVTYCMAWPATTKSLMDHPNYASTDLSSLRRGTLINDVPPELRPSDPTLYPNSLGMTETCGPHSMYTRNEEINGVPPEYRGTFGFTVPGVSVRIVDAETNQEVPEGVEGEVVMRGYSLMLGFYKREREDTFDEDGWYHTGDRGLCRDGWLFFNGRQTDMIKTGGSNVAPAEVEIVLTSFPEVMRAFVYGVPHPERGQDVVAFVVPWSKEDGSVAPIDTDALAAKVKEQLSSFKVPKKFFVLPDADVPWLPSQKVDKRTLIALAEKLAAEHAH
jgi:acyl-CoA synthetase (AMP-forming)/AMP-acid ligase II